jgi:fructokinase
MVKLRTCSDERYNAVRLAGIELGGTKAIAVLADGDVVLDQRIFPTREPGETLGLLNTVLRQWHAEAALSGLGIASFGPVGVDPASSGYGTMLDTPKPMWSQVRIAEALTDGLTCPWLIDTDVNAAALAEYRRGSAIGCDSLCYITLGTGVGGGLVIGGRAVHGAMHPEIGHLRLRRAAGDDFPGICRFHQDCVEGLVSGPALASRFAMEPGVIPSDHPTWQSVASDLGELAACILLTTSAERVVFGGGISVKRPFLLPLIRRETVGRLGGYLPHINLVTASSVIVSTSLNENAGPLGALELARTAAAGHL